jgi:DNA invertase Pin-like site-specific DNA recombinase
LKTTKPLPTSSVALRRAYSYIRFSTPTQAAGNSLKRQTALSQAWAQKKGLTLDASLRMSDLGISAFNGRNRTEGALGVFLAAVAAKKIPKGSYLIVESLDRLSRAQVHRALRLFLDLLEADIVIVTLTDGREYDIVTLDLTDLLISLMIMSRAHEESSVKSFRLKESWKAKRERLATHKLTALAPAWLRLSADRSHFELIPDRVAIVRRLFKDRLGGKGVYRLTRELIEQKIPVWGTRKKAGYTWHKSYVTKILANRAVVGEFQPGRMESGKRIVAGDPVIGYFPSIVSDDVFERVQLLRKNDTGRQGRIGDKVPNLFTHVAKCAYTGHAAVFQDKGHQQYLRSEGTLEDGRRTRGWPYEDFELTFLSGVEHLDLHRIFGEDGESRDAELEAALLVSQANLRRTEATIDRYMREFESGEDSAPERLKRRMLELEDQAKRETEKISAAEAALAQSRVSAGEAEKFKGNLDRLLADRKTIATRMAIRAEIRRLIRRIDVRFEIADLPKEAVKKLERAKMAVPKPVRKGSRSILIVFNNGVHRTIQEVGTDSLIIEVPEPQPGPFAAPTSTPLFARIKEYRPPAIDTAEPQTEAKTRRSRRPAARKRPFPRQNRSDAARPLAASKSKHRVKARA